MTLGDKGALWMTRDSELHIPAIKVNAIDTSGAGDAFIGCSLITMSIRGILKKH